MKKITHSELLSLMHYDPKSGVFTSLVDRMPCIRVGDVIGSMNDRGYLRTSLFYKNYYLHRLAWFYVYGSWPKKIDHKNGVFSDNRIKNLRIATNRQNGRNRGVGINNTSGFVGVCYLKHKGRWHASIKLKHKRLLLGSHIDKEVAVIIRFMAEEFFFGRFQRKEQ